MATLEERVQALEQENASRKKAEERLTQENTDLKQKIELHTIAIGGLINKAALEAINEKNDNIFKALENHDKLTNMQLAEIREKVEVDIEGKIVGMQTEVRQRFTQVETTQQEHTTRLDRMEGRLDRIEGMLTKILDRLPEKP